MDLEWYGRLYDHMEWADASLWRRVLAHGPAVEDDFILDTLLHIHIVQQAYLDVLNGRPTRPKTRSDFARPEDIRDWAMGIYPELRALLSSLDGTALAKPYAVPWAAMIEEAIGQPPKDAALGDLLFQVPSHSVHHRAQVNRRLRELGGGSELVDYIAWVWRGCPGADWS